MTKVFIILGPTSTGKTSLALDLCKEFNGEIISADSRQVCKFMNVGTGKLPFGSKIKAEKQDKCWDVNGIKVWAYDLATPDEYFSGVDFAQFALNKARELEKAGKTIFVVGGTGFYIDLFTGKVKPSTVLPDLELRKSLKEMTLEDLQEKLFELNPKVYEKIDQKNKVRLVRAIEKELGICGVPQIGGVPQKKSNKKSLPYLENAKFIYVGLRAPREILYKKADEWVEKVWEGGLVEEVQQLIKKGYEKSPKLQGLVYKSALEFIYGEKTKEEANQLTKYALHAYIRRQLTYFKKNPEISWIDISKDGYRKIIYNMVKGELKN